MHASNWRAFNRNISSKLGAVLLKTPLSSNHVTTLSIGVALWAGYFFSSGHRLQMICGAAFLHFSFCLNGCGTELAQARGSLSRWGHVYRTAAVFIAGAALWTGLAAGAMALNVPAAAVRGWWLAAMAGWAIWTVRPSDRSVETAASYLLAVIGSPWLFLTIGALAANGAWMWDWYRSYRRGIA